MNSILMSLGQILFDLTKTLRKKKKEKKPTDIKLPAPKHSSQKLGQKYSLEINIITTEN